MFCKKCGSEIKDGIKFCDKCGAAVEEKVQKETMTEEQVSESPATEEQVAETPVAEEPTMEVEANSKKKRGFKPLIIALTAVAVVVAAGLCMKDTLVAWAMKLAPAETQLKYAYTSGAEDLAENLETNIAEYEDTTVSEGGIKGSLSVELSDEFMDLFVGASGIDGLEDLNNASIEMNGSVTESKSYVSMLAKLAGEELLSGEMYVDMEIGEMAVLLPELNDEALYIDMNEYYAEMGMDMDEVAQMSNDLIEIIIPKDGVINKILPKYVEICVAEIENVEKKSDTLKVAGVSQKATAYEAEIDGDVLIKMLEATLKEAKDDDEIKDYLQQLMDGLYEMGYTEDSWDEVKDEYDEGIEYFLDNLKEFDGEDILDEPIYVTTWVDSKFNILAVEIKLSYIEVFFGKATDDDKIGYEITVKEDDEENFSIVGEGTKKGDKLNAEFTASVYEEEYLYLDVEDFIANKKQVSGKITLSGSDSLYEAFDADEIAFATPEIIIDMDITESKLYLQLGVAFVGSEMGKITLDFEECSPVEFEYPEDGTYNANEWVEDFDLEALEEKLMDILPEAIMEAIETSGAEEAYVDSYEDDYSYGILESDDNY